MAYADIAAMTARFGEGELRLLAGDGDGGLDEERIERALADASAEMDGYLAARYRLPLSSTPRLLERLACDVARYGLSDVAPGDHVAKRRDDAIALLRRVATGEISLGLAEDDSTPATSDTAMMSSDESVWARRRRW